MNDEQRRTTCISTKLNAAEERELLVLSGGRPLTGDWLRAFLLDRARRAPIEEVLVGELLAARTVNLTVLQRISPTTDVKAIIEAADKDKRTRAKAALAA